MEVVNFPNDATLSLDDSGKGLYRKGSKTVPVTLVSITPDRGFILKRGDGATFYQRGEREIRLNTLTDQPITPRNFGKDIRTAIPTGGWRGSWTQRGQARYIAPDKTPGPGAGSVFRYVATNPPVQYNMGPWQFTGGMFNAPQVAGEVVNLIDTVSPTMFRMRLAAHNQYLDPGAGTAVEGNLLWSLKIAGVEVLDPYQNINYGGAIVAGRLLKSNDALIPFAYNPDDLPVILPGTPIVYSVTAIANLASADLVSASLFGTMWGDRGDS